MVPETQGIQGAHCGWKNPRVFGGKKGPALLFGKKDSKVCAKGTLEIGADCPFGFGGAILTGFPGGFLGKKNFPRGIPTRGKGGSQGFPRPFNHFWGEINPFQLVSGAFGPIVFSPWGEGIPNSPWVPAFGKGRKVWKGNPPEEIFLKPLLYGVWEETHFPPGERPSPMGWGNFSDPLCWDP